MQVVVLELLLLLWAEICVFVVTCCDVKYIVILATDFMRLPRFVIVPCTHVSFVIAGIFVQMKSGGTQSL